MGHRPGGAVLSVDWAEVAGRVVLEACNPDARDHAVLLGYSPIVDALAERVARVTVVDPGDPRALPANASWHRAAIDAPPDLAAASMVLVHWTWRTLTPARQQALAMLLGKRLPERALLVIGDVMWSLPRDIVDEPEQYADQLEHAPTAAHVTTLLRDAGFLPDLHRFGPAVAVVIGLRANR